MRPSPFDGSAVEYLLMQDITLSTLTISTVYAIIRVSMSARWELCTDTQQPDQVKKAKVSYRFEIFILSFSLKGFPKSNRLTTGNFYMQSCQKECGEKNKP